MTVYSTLLAASSTAPTSLTTVLTIPANLTCVVRDIEYQNYGPAGAVFTVQGSSSGSAVLIHGVTSLAADGSHQWTGRVVLPASSLIQVVASETSIAFSISGYLLTD